MITVCIAAALFASNLLAGQSISYSGDPLGDFTLARFLDRFVYSNLKLAYYDKFKDKVKDTVRYKVKDKDKHYFENTQQVCFPQPEAES